MNGSKGSPTMGALVRGGLGWGCVFTVVFLMSFPLWARPALGVLRFILEGLDSFGSGY